MSKKTETLLNALSTTNNLLLIRGPLGIWFFPLLNTLLQFLYALRKLHVYTPGEPTKKVYQLIRDEKGRIVEIVEVEL